MYKCHHQLPCKHYSINLMQVLIIVNLCWLTLNTLIPMAHQIYFLSNCYFFQSNSDRYIKTMRTHLLPFLQRCDVHNPSSSEHLLHEYLVDLASDGLEQCLLVFQSSKSEVPLSTHLMHSFLN